MHLKQGLAPENRYCVSHMFVTVTTNFDKMVFDKVGVCSQVTWLGSCIAKQMALQPTIVTLTRSCAHMQAGNIDEAIIKNGNQL